MTLSRHEDLSLRYVLHVPSGATADAPRPLVVVMHGRGADANDLADLAPMIDVPPGCRFVFPNAPRRFEPMPGYALGWSWFDGWPPQGASFPQSRELLLRFVSEALERYPTPEGKLIVAGFSQGALMALDCGFRIETGVAGIVAMSGAIHEGDLPDLDAGRERAVLILHGTADDMIPVLAARRTRRVLEDHGIEPEYHELDMGHHVTPESMALVRDFLRRRLA